MFRNCTVVSEYSPVSETQVSFPLKVMNAILSRPESATVPWWSSLELTTEFGVRH